MASLLPLILLLLTTTSAADPCADRRSPSGATDLSIFHSQSHCTSSPQPQPSSFESVLNSATKDPSRLAFLSSLVVSPKPTNVPVASGQHLMQSSNYVLRAKLGTPGQLLFLALDTGADNSFAPCYASSSSSPSFSPSFSSSFSPSLCSSPFCPSFKGPTCPSSAAPVPCSFNMTYGGDSNLTATLSQETLRLALDVIPDYAFACVSSVSGPATSLPKQGLLGLGRGPAGLLSQTSQLYQGVFSYCLPSFQSYYFSGSLRLGPVGQPAHIKTTPLLRNPHRPSLYYVNLTGVSIGRVSVPFPPAALAFDPVTGAGTVVDSGTVITRFVKEAYEAMRDEFRRQLNATEYTPLGAFDTCFATDGSPVPAAAVPPVTLHLEGLDLRLPVENVLIHSSARPLACLAMAAAPDNVNAVVNVIANLQQQNFRVLFDTVNSRVGFARELCN